MGFSQVTGSLLSQASGSGGWLVPITDMGFWRVTGWPLSQTWGSGGWPAASCHRHGVLADDWLPPVTDIGFWRVTGWPLSQTLGSGGWLAASCHRHWVLAGDWLPSYLHHTFWVWAGEYSLPIQIKYVVLAVTACTSLIHVRGVEFWLASGSLFESQIDR